MEKVKELKVNKKSKSKVEKCYGCDGVDILPVDDFKIEFTDENQTTKGFICNDCKTFHYFDEEKRLNYINTFNEDIQEKEVKWNIN